MYSYDGLERRMADHGITRQALGQQLHISSRTLAKVAKGEKISLRVLKKIAAHFQCEPTDLYRIVSDNPTLQRLREEKDAHISGGLYHELQVRMTYNAKTSVTIEDIICFHAAFEQIHPFQDGNGRVGRLIALKECLHHGIVPFIIEDRKKAFYYRGLYEWNREPGYLMDTCLDGQDTFRQLLQVFGL